MRSTHGAAACLKFRTSSDAFPRNYRLRAADSFSPSSAPVTPLLKPHSPHLRARRKNAFWLSLTIGRRLPIDFPHATRMRISHEAIYQALYVHGRGALLPDLSACLRTGWALRVPRARTLQRGKSLITSEVMINQRPTEAADRAVPGHWEGDMSIALNSSATRTLVERTARFTLLLHLPRLTEYVPGAGVKTGPVFAGCGAKAARDAIAKKIQILPAPLRRSLTWDQGAEQPQHVQRRIEIRLEVYFCDPRNP